MRTAGSGIEQPVLGSGDQVEPRTPGRGSRDQEGTSWVSAECVPLPPPHPFVVWFLRLPFASFLRILLFEQQQDNERKLGRDWIIRARTDQDQC